MITRFLRPAGIGILIGILTVSACGPVSPWRDRLPVATPQLTDSEMVAGEIMAYLIEVVLGQSGPPAGRSAWAVRGNQLPLDFALVKRRMFGPVPLRAEMMVLDTNILGLSQVMYHYDRRLNLFKGTGEQDSLYPCAELMALRLLLMRKLAREEKVSLRAIAGNKALFTSDNQSPGAEALAAMNLTDEEFRFLKAVFQSEPAFWRYMQHPFIVSTLKRIGVVEQDILTLMADQSANYRPWACPAPGFLKPKNATIAILPSMTALFAAPDGAGGQVTPEPEYLRLLNRLQSAILDGIARQCNEAGRPVQAAALPTFFSPPHPMVVHPENAGRVIETVCPKADFTVIVLGKNIYRALAIDPDSDVFPHQRRTYLDVDDIRYQGMDEAVQAVVQAVMPAPLTRSTPGT